MFFRPFGALLLFCYTSHGLRRGLHSCAASRLLSSSLGVGSCATATLTERIISLARLFCL